LELTWLKFAICLVLILISGTQLSKYGDIIAEKVGLTRAWIGLILLASVTSLPELFTGISSVTIHNLPDIAAGDILGSCVFNLLLIALLDALHGPRPIFAVGEPTHVLSAGFSIILLMIPGLAIITSPLVDSGAIWISVYTPIIIVSYLVSIRVIFLFEKKKLTKLIEKKAEEMKYREISATRACSFFTLNALVIIVAASWLPGIGGDIVRQAGLTNTFVGSIFVALATSLPELVVSISALRIGACDMAIANLLGSNLFNIFILGLDDIFFIKGPFFSSISPENLIAVFSAIAMTAIAMVGLTYRSARKQFKPASWEAVGMAGIYVLFLYLLYRSGAV